MSIMSRFTVETDNYYYTNHFWWKLQFNMTFVRPRKHNIKRHFDKILNSKPKQVAITLSLNEKKFFGVLN